MRRTSLKPNKEVHEPAERKNLFRTMCKSQGKCCKLIIDNGSIGNLVSVEMVEYIVSWLQKGHHWMCHVLLGRCWWAKMTRCESSWQLRGYTRWKVPIRLALIWFSVPDMIKGHVAAMACFSSFRIYRKEKVKLSEKNKNGNFFWEFLEVLYKFLFTQVLVPTVR